MVSTVLSRRKGTFWSVALADRASRTGYVPKTNFLKVGSMPSSSSSQPQSGMLGSADASKFQAVVNSDETRGMFFKKSRSMEKCAQSMLLLFNLPALFAPGNLKRFVHRTSSETNDPSVIPSFFSEKLFWS